MIKKSLVNKFVIYLILKTLGPNFTESFVASILKSYVVLPDVEQFKEDFNDLIDYFSYNLDEFIAVVQEYLSKNESDPDLIKRISETMLLKKDDVWSQQSPANEEKTLKDVAQEVSSGQKPVPKETKRPQVADMKSTVIRDPKTGRFIKKEA